MVTTPSLLIYINFDPLSIADQIGLMLIRLTQIEQNVFTNSYVHSF